MVRDEHLRQVRSEAGAKGGNPDLLKQKVKQEVKPCVGSALLGSGNGNGSGSEGESEGEPAIPTADEVVRACEMIGIPGDYAREQHARHDEKHQWVCNTPIGP